MGLYPRLFIIWYSPPIKSTNQQGCIKTSRENPREPSCHFIDLYYLTGHFLAIAVEVLLSVVTAIVQATARSLEAIAGLYPQANSASAYSLASSAEMSSTCLTQYCPTCVLNEPRREKTGLRGFRPGPTQTDLYQLRKELEA